MTLIIFAKWALSWEYEIFYTQLRMKKLIDWHKSLIESAQKQLGLSNYALYLAGILEGALYMWIVLKIIPWFFLRKAEFPDF